MGSRACLLCVLLTFYTYGTGRGQTANRKAVAVSNQCLDLYNGILARAQIGSVLEVERSLTAELNFGGASPGDSCTAAVMHNLAVGLLGRGRLAEAKAFAVRSVELFLERFPATDPTLLWPLQVQAAVHFELGETTKAMEAYRKMASIPTQSPEDRACVLEMGGTLLQAQARLPEAEQHYLAALAEWRQAGRGLTASAAGTLSSLGSLYLSQNRLEDAGQVLLQARNIFNSATDTVPVDQIKVLNSWGILHSRRSEWQDAVKTLSDALSLAEGVSQVPSLLLSNYAYALRKAHRKTEARQIEARSKALSASEPTSGVIDLAELLGETKNRKQ